MNRWLKNITGFIPFSIYQSVFKRDIISFFYHVISDESLPHIKHIYAYKSPKMFEDDLIYLLKNYTPISYEQIVTHQQDRTRLKSNSVFLSFDDGCRECFTIARPLLLKYGVPCTFFVTTDLIDNQKMIYSSKVSMCIDKVMTSDSHWRQAVFGRLNPIAKRSIKNEQDFIQWIKPLRYSDQEVVDWICDTLDVDIQGYLSTQKPFMSLDELRILASDGFTLGAHTRSHRLLNKLPQEAIEQEIVESCGVIQKITGADSIPFAFPWHGDGLKRSLLEDIRTRNKVVGYLFDTNGLRQHKGWILGRIWADAPELNGSDRSNLPRMLYLSYQDLVFGWLRKFKDELPFSARSYLEQR